MIALSGRETDWSGSWRKLLVQCLASLWILKTRTHIICQNVFMYVLKVLCFFLELDLNKINIACVMWHIYSEIFMCTHNKSMCLARLQSSPSFGFEWVFLIACNEVVVAAVTEYRKKKREGKGMQLSGRPFA